MPTPTLADVDAASERTAAVMAATTHAGATQARIAAAEQEMDTLDRWRAAEPASAAAADADLAAAEPWPETAPAAMMWDGPAAAAELQAELEAG